MGSDARFGMKTPVMHVNLAIQMYYQGMSLNSIRQELLEKYNNCPSDSTIYHWISKYSDRAVSSLTSRIPNVGTTWIADETRLMHHNQPLLIWDILDRDTWFLIATQIFFQRSSENAWSLLKQAVQRTGRIPCVISTAKLGKYYSDIKHDFDDVIIKYPGKVKIVIEKKSARELEYFHNMLEWRKNHMNDLRSIDSISKYNDGWLIYYNYFRPHSYLVGKTPAEAAGVSYPVTDHNGIRALRRAI